MVREKVETVWGTGHWESFELFDMDKGRSYIAVAAKKWQKSAKVYIPRHSKLQFTIPQSFPIWFYRTSGTLSILDRDGRIGNFPTAPTALSIQPQPKLGMVKNTKGPKKSGHHLFGERTKWRWRQSCAGCGGKVVRGKGKKERAGLGPWHNASAMKRDEGGKLKKWKRGIKEKQSTERESGREEKKKKGLWKQVQ